MEKTFYFTETRLLDIFKHLADWILGATEDETKKSIHSVSICRGLPHNEYGQTVSVKAEEISEGFGNWTTFKLELICQLEEILFADPKIMEHRGPAVIEITYLRAEYDFESNKVKLKDFKYNVKSVTKFQIVSNAQLGW